jgi:hypothetical protein
MPARMNGSHSPAANAQAGEPEPKENIFMFIPNQIGKLACQLELRKSRS